MTERVEFNTRAKQDLPWFIAHTVDQLKAAHEEGWVIEWPISKTIWRPRDPGKVWKWDSPDLLEYIALGNYRIRTDKKYAYMRIAECWSINSGWYTRTVIARDPVEKFVEASIHPHFKEWLTDREVITTNKDNTFNV